MLDLGMALCRLDCVGKTKVSVETVSERGKSFSVKLPRWEAGAQLWFVALLRLLLLMLIVWAPCSSVVVVTLFAKTIGTAMVARHFFFYCNATLLTCASDLSWVRVALCSLYQIPPIASSSSPYFLASSVRAPPPRHYLRTTWRSQLANVWILALQPASLSLVWFPSSTGGPHHYTLPLRLVVVAAAVAVCSSSSRSSPSW